MRFVVLRELGALAREWVVSLKRSVVVCDLSPSNVSSSVRIREQGTHLQDIVCVNYSAPIIVHHLEGRPQDVLHCMVVVS